jgi:hypothetical protein
MLAQDRRNRSVIGLLGADIGLQAANIFRSPPQIQTGHQNQRSGNANEGPSSEGMARIQSAPTASAISQNNNGQTPKKQMTLVMPSSGILDSKFTDYVLAAATIALVVLAFLQLLTYRSQRDLAKRAMTIVDEPRFVVRDVEFIIPAINRSASSIFCVCKIQNIGRTPAFIRAEFKNFLLEDELPRQPLKTTPDHPSFATVATGFCTEITAYLGGSEEEIAAIRAPVHANDKRQFFVVARLIYDDVFGNQHEWGFCYRTGRRGGAYIPHGGPTNNYRRLRKPEEHI